MKFASIAWLVMAAANPGLLDSVGLQIDPANTYRNENTERSVMQIRAGVRDAMKSEAAAEHGTSDHVRAIGRLMALHGEIVRHSTFADGFALAEYRSLLQIRLVRVRRKILRDLRFGRLKSHDEVAGPDGIRPSERARPLAQFAAGPAGGGPFGNPGGNGAPGAGGGGGAAGGLGFGQIPDYGVELAELIQQVIDPQFWDVNGGPGTVVYYRPRQVLVIRATSDMHHRLGGFLQDMRAAGP